MADQLAICYVHRHNEDATHDSICLLCFRTIASQKDENNLEQVERTHVCNVADLYQHLSRVYPGNEP